MRKPSRKKRGQFVIIAVMLVAIMIISIGALLHNAATYYKHEPWEEYSTLISDIEINTHRILEVSLVEYIGSNDPSILNSNLNQWSLDLLKMYPEKSIKLSYNITQGSTDIYGQTLDFEQGLAKIWNQRTSSSAARANFTLEIESIGLSGYRFAAESFLKAQIVSNSSSGKTVDIVVYRENNVTIPDLKDASFKANGVEVDVTSTYSPSLAAISYKIYYAGIEPPTIEVQDQRGITVTAKP